MDGNAQAGADGAGQGAPPAVAGFHVAAPGTPAALLPRPVPVAAPAPPAGAVGGSAVPHAGAAAAAAAAAVGAPLDLDIEREDLSAAREDNHPAHNRGRSDSDLSSGGASVQSVPSVHAAQLNFSMVASSGHPTPERDGGRSNASFLAELGEVGSVPRLEEGGIGAAAASAAFAAASGGRSRNAGGSGSAAASAASGSSAGAGAAVQRNASVAALTGASSAAAAAAGAGAMQRDAIDDDDDDDGHDADADESEGERAHERGAAAVRRGRHRRGGIREDADNDGDDREGAFSDGTGGTDSKSEDGEHLRDGAGVRGSPAASIGGARVRGGSPASSAGGAGGGGSPGSIAGAAGHADSPGSIVGGSGSVARAAGARGGSPASAAGGADGTAVRRGPGAGAAERMRGIVARPEAMAALLHSAAAAAAQQQSIPAGRLAGKPGIAVAVAHAAVIGSSSSSSAASNDPSKAASADPGGLQGGVTESATAASSSAADSSAAAASLSSAALQPGSSDAADGGANAASTKSTDLATVAAAGGPEAASMKATGATTGPAAGESNAGASDGASRRSSSGGSGGTSSGTSSDNEAAESGSRTSRGRGRGRSQLAPETGEAAAASNPTTTADAAPAAAVGGAARSTSRGRRLSSAAPAAPGADAAGVQQRSKARRSRASTSASTRSSLSPPKEKKASASGGAAGVGASQSSAAGAGAGAGSRGAQAAAAGSGPKSSATSNAAAMPASTARQLTRVRVLLAALKSMYADLVTSLGNVSGSQELVDVRKRKSRPPEIRDDGGGVRIGVKTLGPGYAGLGPTVFMTESEMIAYRDARKAEGAEAAWEEHNRYIEHYLRLGLPRLRKEMESVWPAKRLKLDREQANAERMMQEAQHDVDTLQIAVKLARRELDSIILRCPEAAAVKMPKMGQLSDEERAQFGSTVGTFVGMAKRRLSLAVSVDRSKERAVIVLNEAGEITHRSKERAVVFHRDDATGENRFAVGSRAPEMVIACGADGSEDDDATAVLLPMLIESAKAAAACERELAESSSQAVPRRSVQALEAQLARLGARMQQVQASSAATGSTANVVAGVQLARRYRILAAALKEIR